MNLTASMLRSLIWVPNALTRLDLATYSTAIKRISRDSFPMVRIALWELMDKDQINTPQLPHGPIRNMACILKQIHGSSDEVASLLD